MLAAPSGRPTAEPSPWVLAPGSKANVVHLWLAPTFPAPAATASSAAPGGSDAAMAEAEWGENDEDGLEAASGVPSSGPAGFQVGDSAATEPGGSRVLPYDTELASLVGPALLTRLTAEVAALLKEEPSNVPSDVSLQDLGMDSLLLTQFSGMLQHEYDFKQLRDEMMFAETTTTAWLVDMAPALRGDTPITVPAAVPAPDIVAMHPAPVLHAVDLASASSTSVPPAAVAGNAQSNRDTAQAAALSGVAEVGLMTRRGPKPRKQSSWFEANCPCCMFCW